MSKWKQFGNGTNGRYIRWGIAPPNGFAYLPNQKQQWHYCFANLRPSLCRMYLLVCWASSSSLSKCSCRIFNIISICCYCCNISQFYDIFFCVLFLHDKYICHLLRKLCAVELLFRLPPPFPACLVLKNCHLIFFT